MWGDELPTRSVRERLKLLLDSHRHDLRPRPREVQPGDLLLRQGEPADRLVLLTSGRVAIELRQEGGPPHILAVLEAEELLGELGLFGSGRFSADVRVVDGPASTIEVEAEAFLRTLLFDVDLAIELLALVCRRCTHSNAVVGQLLAGIAAAHDGDSGRLAAVHDTLTPLDHSLAEAARQLRSLGG
jgi:CRP-like cAMP-binding protein